MNINDNLEKYYNADFDTVRCEVKIKNIYNLNIACIITNYYCNLKVTHNIIIIIITKCVVFNVYVIFFECRRIILVIGKSLAVRLKDRYR